MHLNIHVVGPRSADTHTHTVILLHGRDSTNTEFASEFFESEASEPAGQARTLPDLFPTFKWVFPSASLVRSERFDTTMSQWYDMWSVESPDDRPELQMSGMRQSTVAILDVIRDEETVVGRDKIFLGGISQGFSVAVSAFFAGGREFAGLLGFCSWMPLESFARMLMPAVGHIDLELLQRLYLGERGREMSTESMKATPVLLAHSRDDSVVPVENGRRLHALLARLLPGPEVEWHEYADGGHWINEPQGVNDIVSFFRRHI